MEAFRPNNEGDHNIFAIELTSIATIWKVKPLQSTDFRQSAKGGLFGVRHTLFKCQVHLRKLREAFRMLEMSYGTELLISLLRDDALHMDSLALQYEPIPGNVPRCLSDLLGIIFNTRSPALDQKPFEFYPINLSDELRQQLLLQKAIPPPSWLSSGGVNPSNALWELYSQLGRYDWTRLGAVDVQEGVVLELSRNDTPQTLSEEGFRVRCIDAIF